MDSNARVRCLRIGALGNRSAKDIGSSSLIGFAIDVSCALCYKILVCDNDQTLGSEAWFTAVDLWRDKGTDYFQDVMDRRSFERTGSRPYILIGCRLALKTPIAFRSSWVASTCADV